MSQIEAIILVILLLMTVPDVCERRGRPTLTYLIYMVVGFLVGPLMKSGTHEVLVGVGEFGFVLLLFGIGLEIDLPRRNYLVQALKDAGKWSLFTVPLATVLGVSAVGLSWQEALLAAAALSSCSVGLAYPALKGFEGLTAEWKQRVLTCMVVLEVEAIVVLAASDAMVTHGMGWRVVLQLVGILVAIVVVGFTANHSARLLSAIIGRMAHWRVHLIVLAVMIVSAIGERLGLSAPKTAFFLGLFMSRATHEGLSIEEHLRPLSQKLLIPIFLVALGTQVSPDYLLSRVGLVALFSAVLILAYREVAFRRWLYPSLGVPRAYHLLGPNLTMAAVGMQVMGDAGASGAATAWVASVGLLVTLMSVLGLPRHRANRGPSA